MADIVFGMGASHSPMLAIKPDQWPLRAEDDKKNPRHFFRGRQFSFEILLADPAFERVALPYVQTLSRLGMEVKVRTVDPAQFQRRTDTYDFDMTVNVFAM